MSASGVPAPKDAVIRTRGVGYQYPKSESWAVRGIDFSVTAGSVHAVVGPNGSGKSTLLKLVTGALRPAEGTAELWGKPVRSWAPRDLAQRLAVVTQREAPAFPVTVRDLVAAGRYAHLGPFRSETAGDREAVEQALEQCGIPDLAERSVRELSGGEFQRARIARALAQEPKVLVLDEPTSALDVRYQMSILDLLTELRETRALTVVFVTHRLALAARFADTLLLLHHGHVVREGEPRFVLHSETLSEVYGWPLAVLDVDVPQVGSVPMIIPQSRQGS